jgi:cytochrome P450
LGQSIQHEMSHFAPTPCHTYCELTSIALRNYESRVNKHTDELIRQISSFSGRELNATKWFNYYSFDVMGDLSFGKSFNMLTKGEEHYAIKLLHENTRPVGILSPIPWFLLICTKIPFAMDEIKRFLSYSEQCVEERKMMKVSEPDIMSYILEAEPTFSDSRKEHLLLVGDSRLIIVAGSDTSAAALTHIFYHLAKDPSQVQKVRAELKNVPSGNEFSIQALQGLHHLNGVINEALRLHPPVPGGVYRDSPKEGFQVGDRFVPGEVTILTPTYSIHRCM